VNARTAGLGTHCAWHCGVSLLLRAYLCWLCTSSKESLQAEKASRKKRPVIRGKHFFAASALGPEAGRRLLRPCTNASSVRSADSGLHPLGQGRGGNRGAARTPGPVLLGSRGGAFAPKTNNCNPKQETRGAGWLQLGLYIDATEAATAAGPGQTLFHQVRCRNRWRRERRSPCRRACVCRRAYRCWSSPQVPGGARVPACVRAPHMSASPHMQCACKWRAASHFYLLHD
jgi:hypothetical protein